MSSQWIDVSIPLRTGMVHWPDHPLVVIERVLDRERGDAAHVSKLSLSAHTGTHMDAPIHFLREGAGIDQMTVTAAMGRARVIAIASPEKVTMAELQRYQIRRGERVLFKTRNSTRVWQSDTFVTNFVYIAQDAARHLAKLGVQTVGVDYLSVGGFSHDGSETHQALLEAGIWIIEGLNLSAVEAGDYELVCLPLRIFGGDGAPARAVMRKVDAGTTEV
jgi:arylformamidase